METVRSDLKTELQVKEQHIKMMEDSVKTFKEKMLSLSELTDQTTTKQLHEVTPHHDAERANKLISQSLFRLFVIAFILKDYYHLMVKNSKIWLILDIFFMLLNSFFFFFEELDFEMIKEFFICLKTRRISLDGRAVS